MSSFPAALEGWEGLAHLAEGPCSPAPSHPAGIKPEGNPGTCRAAQYTFSLKTNQLWCTEKSVRPKPHAKFMLTVRTSFVMVQF